MSSFCRSWRSRLALGAVIGVCGGVVGVARQLPVAAEHGGYQEYVALGDSAAAATTLVPLPDGSQAPLGCDQAPYSYPKLVAAALGVPVFRDAVCSGATTAHMTTPQVTPLGTNAPQFDRLTPTTDLVTLTIGANDVDAASAVVGCMNLLPTPSPACPAAVDASRSRIPQMEQAVTGVIHEILQRSPNANIFFVNYITLFRPQGCWPVIPIANADMALLDSLWAEEQAAMARAAAAGGAHLVDVYAASIGHDPCAEPTVRWAEGLVPLSVNGLGVVIPFHPNSAGANAQASLAIAAIGAVPPNTTTATTSSTTSTSVATTMVPTSTEPPTTTALTTSTEPTTTTEPQTTTSTQPTTTTELQTTTSTEPTTTTGPPTTTATTPTTTP